MSDKVVDIADYRPHTSGKCLCLQCKHEWVCVAPVGTMCFECPECGTFRGVHNALIYPDVYLQCRDCKCSHFIFGLDFKYCAGCGLATRKED